MVRKTCDFFLKGKTKCPVKVSLRGRGCGRLTIALVDKQLHPRVMTRIADFDWLWKVVTQTCGGVDHFWSIRGRGSASTFGVNVKLSLPWYGAEVSLY